MKTTEDEPIERIRRTRHEISAQHGHDPRRLVEYYVEPQKAHEQRLIDTAAPTHELMGEAGE